MNDRNLSEPSRGLEQALQTIKRQINALQRSVARPGVTRVGSCVRTFFDGGTLGDRGFWFPKTMVEFDVDPGRWLINANLQFELPWTGFGGALGYQVSHLFINWRAVGDPDDGAHQIGSIVFQHAPMAAPINPGVAQSVAYKTVLPGATPISSDTGLTVQLQGMFTIANGSVGSTPGDDFWLGPGTLIATPL